MSFGNRHDGHTLGVDRAEVGVLEEADESGLCGLLVTGGRYGGAHYPGGEWAERVSAYVVYNKCL